MTIAVQVTKDDGGIDYWTYQLVKELPPAIAGRWKLANEAGSAGVGPAPGNVEWWNLGAGDLTARACFMDDVYVFGADGSFSLELGDQTWLETWQSDAEACGTPVAPHDGSGTYSYTYVAGETITINGAGAYIGIAKAGNTYAYESNGVPTSIIYTVESLNAAETAMTIAVQVTKDDGGIDYWTYQLVKGDSAGGTDPVDPEAGDLGTGDNNILDAGEVINFNSTTPGTYTLEDFGNNVSTLIADPTDATNTVVSVIKGNETWAGTTITSGTVIYPLTSTDTVMTVRVWSPEAGVTVRLKLEESGDPTHSVETDAVTTKAQEWETLTFDFSNQGEGTAELNTDYVFDKLSIFLNFGSVGSSETYYFDDVTFVGAGSAVTAPTASAPAPSADIADVVSIFSDAYTDLESTNFNPDWGQATAMTTETIDDGSVLKYAGLNYQGTALSAAQDVSGYDTLHVDFWTADSTALNLFLINSAAATGGDAVEVAYAFDVSVTGSWVSVDIPLSSFSPVDLTMVDQMKVDGNGTIFLDNIYFSKSTATPTAPTASAPAPSADIADVVSIFSDAYTDLESTNFNPDWGQATAMTTETIDDGSVLKYAGLNYQGTALSAAQDVSGYDTLHVDFWTADSTALNLFLINSAAATGGDAVEVAYAFDVSVTGSWVSVDIPLSSFSPVDLTMVDQMKVDGNGTIFLDNIYFSK